MVTTIKVYGNDVNLGNLLKVVRKYDTSAILLTKDKVTNLNPAIIAVGSGSGTMSFETLNWILDEPGVTRVKMFTQDVPAAILEQIIRMGQKLYKFQHSKTLPVLLRCQRRIEVLEYWKNYAQGQELRDICKQILQQTKYGIQSQLNNILSASRHD